MKQFFFLFMSLVTLFYHSDLAFALTANAKDSLKIVPHRAVYDMTLNDLKNGTNVSALKGRLVFEISDSSCDGYTTNMRFVTQIIDNQGGNKITDWRSSSWEDGKGDRFRFNSSHYSNRKLDQTTSGDAKRLKKDDRVEIKIKLPKEGRLKLPSGVLFPTQHTLHIIQAALDGKAHLHADIYDGSEKGNKVYETTAIIGKAISPEKNAELGQIKNAETLNKLASWPIAISYFDKGTNSEIPSYQIGFRLFANGVSRKLLIDYGDFSLKGALRKIDFFEQTQCKR